MAQPNEVPTTPIPRVVSAVEAAKIVEAANAPELPKEKAKDPKGEEEYTFSISLKGGNGAIISGSFKNRILDLEQRISIGLRASVMVGRVPWEILDADTRWLVTALAHLSVSLVEKPEWFAKMLAMGTGASRNVRVIEKIYAEVALHEQYFRGSDTPEETGA